MSTPEPIQIPASVFAEPARYTNQAQMLVTNEGVIFEFRAMLPGVHSLPTGEHVVSMELDLTRTPPHTRIFMPYLAAVEFKNLLERNFKVDEVQPPHP